MWVVYNFKTKRGGLLLLFKIITLGSIPLLASRILKTCMKTRPNSPKQLEWTATPNVAFHNPTTELQTFLLSRSCEKINNFAVTNFDVRTPLKTRNTV